MRRRSRTSLAWIIAAAIVLVSSLALAQPKPRGRELAGTVVDADQKPVANATVTVAGGPSATTGADGSFKLAGVATGNLVVEIKADGFTTRTIPVLAATTRAVAAGRARQAAGAGWPGDAHDRRRRHRRQSPAARRRAGQGARHAALATTAADGTFTIAGVAYAAVTLDVEVAGQPPTSVTVAADKTAVVVAGRSGRTRTVNRSRRSRARCIGRVVRSVVAASRSLPRRSWSRRPAQVIFTEADGSFVIDNAPTGPFDIQVSAGEHETRDAQGRRGPDHARCPARPRAGRADRDRGPRTRDPQDEPRERRVGDQTTKTSTACRRRPSTPRCRASSPARTSSSTRARPVAAPSCGCAASRRSTASPRRST